MELNAICKAAPQTRAPYQQHGGSGSARPGTDSATGKYWFCRSPDPGLRTAKQVPLQHNDSGGGKQHKTNLISIPPADFRWGWWGWDQLENTGDPKGSISLKAQMITLRSDPFLHPSGIDLGCFTCKSKSISSFSLL